MPGRPRDNQRSRLYRAEDAVPRGRELPSVEAMQEFVDRVVDSASWQRVGNAPRTVIVRDGRGRRGACAEGAWHGAVLRIPRWARCERILLHELAHAATPDHRAAHGPEFAGRYLALVRRFLSEGIWEELRRSFIEHRVAFDELTEVLAGESSSGDRGDPRRVLQLVRELRALAAGSDSPAESASAAEKAQRLLLKHNLTVSDVEAIDTDDDPLVEESQPFDGVRRRVPAWKQMLVQAVARGSLCEWMTSFTHESRPRSYSFIGRRSNVEVACYLYRCLERQVDEQWQAQRRELRRRGEPVRGRRASFCEGMVEGIDERLARQRRHFAAASVAQRAVVRARDGEAEAYRMKLYPNVTFTTRSIEFEPTARDSGLRAARNVRLHHALDSEGRPRKLLK